MNIKLLISLLLLVSCSSPENYRGPANYEQEEKEQVCYVKNKQLVCEEISEE